MFSEWHIGSGLGAGAEIDAQMLKDENGIPYIPGKTIKGLIKEACLDIHEINTKLISEIDIKNIFEGNSENNIGSVATFFSNAKLDKNEYIEIKDNGLSSYIYKILSSTAIDKNGIADDKSLRTIEVAMPTTLHGTIEIDEQYKFKIKEALKWVRHIGTNRNRGLGRCKFKFS